MPHSSLIPVPLLLLLQHLDDPIEVGVRFTEVLAFGRHVAVVETVVRRSQFFQKLERHLHALDGHLDGIGAIFPRAFGATGPEGVTAHATEGVPVGHRESQLLLHGFAFDLLVRVVVAETERIGRSRTFVADLVNVWKECHRCTRGLGIVGVDSVTIVTAPHFANVPTYPASFP